MPESKKLRPAVAAMSATNVVVAVLVAGPVSILAAAISLAQFRVLFTVLSDFASKRSRIPLLDFLRPGKLLHSLATAGWHAHMREAVRAEHSPLSVLSTRRPAVT